MRWTRADEGVYFHIASRNGLFPESMFAHTGIRLVADLER